MLALIRMLWTDLEGRKFLWIDPKHSDLLDREDLFGKEVWEKFPQARIDIKDSGNCIATACSTAAVFHLMRSTELGLRYIAKELDVELTDKGQTQPLEYADWNKVITGIKNKITDIRKMNSGPQKEAKLQAYSDAADHCEYLKDLWRNDICHTRKSYNEGEALGVFERVKQFMQLLAKAIW